MNETGNSSVLDASEGALVMDLSRGTDDSQLTDTSRSTPSDSKTTDSSRGETEESEQTKTTDSSRGETEEDFVPRTTSRRRKCSRSRRSQPSRTSGCNNSDREEAGVNVTGPDTSGESNKGGTEVNHTEEDRGQIDSAHNEKPPLLASDEDTEQRGKYTPQRVDLKMARMAVNAYVSPSKLRSLYASQRGSSEPAGVHGDKIKDRVNKSPWKQSMMEADLVDSEKENLPVCNVALQSKPTIDTRSQSPSRHAESNQDIPTGECSSSPTEKTSTHKEGAGSSFTNKGEQSKSAKHGQTKSKTADLYSREKSKPCSNMQHQDHTPKAEKSNSPEDEEEEMEDVNDTGNHGDHSKMEEEMDTSQVQEGGPVQQQSTEIWCALCNNWFLNINSYTMHKAKHAKQNSPLLGLKCEQCKKMYYYEMEFKAHAQAHIEMLSMHKCRVCSEPFAEKSELKRHMKIHQDKKEFSCQVCGKEFHYTFNLKKHMRTHTGEKPYVCILCELKFTHKNSLNRHMSLHTNETEFECCVCDKVCPDRWSLQKHLASHQILTCTECDQSFNNSKQLQEHKKTHTEAKKDTPGPENNRSKLVDSAQSNAEKSDVETKPETDRKSKGKRVRKTVETQCDVCRKVFKNPGNYYRHLQAKEGMAVQTCELCGLHFHDVYDLLKHTRQVHSQTSDAKGYLCQVCGQSHPNLARLTEHMSEHLQKMNKAGAAGSEKLQSMNKAGRAVSEHVTPRADGPMSLYCTVCGEKFVNPIMLNLHMMMHSSSMRVSENALDLSQSREEASQSPPRKRLKLETEDNEETHVEYYDSDKENEPLNLSKKTYSPPPKQTYFPLPKPKALRVHQKQVMPVLPWVSSTSRYQKSRPPNSSENVGLDLSCKSKSPEASQGDVAGDQTGEQDQEISKPQSADKDFTKGVEKSETQSTEDGETQSTEDGDTPMKSSATNSNVAMEMTGEDFPDDNLNVTDKSDHLDHLSDHSSRPGSPLVTLTCEYCAMTFSDLVALNKHLSSHYKEWAFYCNYCNTMFAENDSYISHTSVHPSHTPYMCNVCQAHFSDRISLGAHQSQTHPQDKPFLCGVCQRRFPVKSYLGSHCRTHLPERPFRCSLCDRTFVHNFNLTKHMRTHTGEKPYTCSWCERKFSQKNSLNRHEKIHMRETPSKEGIQPVTGSGQLFSPAPGQEDTPHGQTTPCKSDRSTPVSLNSPEQTTPRSQHKEQTTPHSQRRNWARQNRSRNSSTSSNGTHRATPDPIPSNGTHRATPDPIPEDLLNSLSPEVLQQMYLQQMAIIQYVVQQQQHENSMNPTQNPYFMAAYMQQMQMLQQIAEKNPHMFPHQPASLESMLSSHSKVMEHYGKNLQQQKTMDPAPSPRSHEHGTQL